MSTATLSPAALAICAQHYRNGAGCGRCPIHHACASGCTPLTWQTLAAWQQRVADAAARVKP